LGKAWLGDVCYTGKRLGKLQAGEKFLEEIAQATGGSVRRYDKSLPQVIGPNGRGVDVAQLLELQEQWKKAMANFISAVKES